MVDSSLQKQTTLINKVLTENSKARETIKHSIHITNQIYIRWAITKIFISNQTQTSLLLVKPLHNTVDSPVVVLSHPRVSRANMQINMAPTSQRE